MKLRRKVTLTNLLPQSRMFDAYKRIHNTGLFYQLTSIGHALFTTEHDITRSAREYCSYALLYIVKGEIEFNFNGDLTLCPARHIVIIDCYREHSYKGVSRDNEVYYVHFEGGASGMFYSTIATQHGNCFTVANFDSHVAQLAQIVNAIDRQCEYDVRQFSKTIYGILSDCVEPDCNKPQTYSFIVKQIKSHIDSNYDCNIRLSRFYQNIYVSSQYAIKLFKEEVGITPYQYMLDQKLNAALKLIMESNTSIENIVATLGFSSCSNFNKLFKNKFSFSPSYFRKFHE